MHVNTWATCSPLPHTGSVNAYSVGSKEKKIFPPTTFEDELRPEAGEFIFWPQEINNRNVPNVFNFNYFLFPQACKKAATSQIPRGREDIILKPVT